MSRARQPRSATRSATREVSEMMGCKGRRLPSSREHCQPKCAHRRASRSPERLGRWRCPPPHPITAKGKEASRAGWRDRSGVSPPASGLAARSPRICRCRGARLLRGGLGGSLTTCTPQVLISSGSSREPPPEMLRPSKRSRGQKMTSGRRPGRRGGIRRPQEP